MAYVPQWHTQQGIILQIASEVRAKHPAAWNELKVPGQKSRRYINLVSMGCIAVAIPAGVNLKRGGPEQSIDALALPNATGAEDSTHTFAGVEIVDIVGNAEGPNPSLIWKDVTQDTIDAGTRGGWKAGSLADPEPPHTPTYPSYEELGGDEGGKKITRLLEADYKRAKGFLDGECGTWPQRTNYDFLTRKVATIEESIAKHQPEWRAALNAERVANGLPPITW